ncbi:amidase [Rufibacter radiotolerans]|uniref:Amidase n=1 Tax=Rufibacter radiotolerans TaxID=1379910 RepID=A0A0H4VMY1_9BACT|nr:amidase [Rufibacter radiotolerans]AKQ45099.1 amidase [Rufibacter radiotolerans]
MNRRNFIRTGSLAGVTFSALGLSACATATTAPATPETPVATAPDVFKDDFKLNEATIQELQQKMQKGELTSRQITQMYLDRIQAIDKSGPKINSVIEVNPDALQIADAMDQERKAGKLRGPLHGIPVMVKDNIDTADKMSTSAGALALADNKASKDAFIVARLRAAGAVLIGKTNLSEWANFRSTKASSGWSSRGGQTRNPYVLDRTPCGSSSGSGVAVAANLCTVSVGTETNGSIVCPAAVNGLVGFKPTVRLVSRSGIIPISHTQDTAGPLARTVTDAAILLGVLAGVDNADEVTKESSGKAHPDYTKFLDANGLQGKRIGVEKSFMKGHVGIDELLEQALNVLKSKGATIVEVEMMKKIREVSGKSFTVLQYEFKDGVNKYLATSNGKVKSLKEVIEFNKRNEAQAMPFFKQEILEMSEKLGDLNTKEYKEAVTKQVSGSREAINQIMQEHKLDAITGPSYGPSWCIDLVNGDSFTGYGLSTPAAISGFPHITLPMGQVQNLPIGLSFFGKAYTEPELLKIAYAYEQASKLRRAPMFRKSAVSA